MVGRQAIAGYCRISVDTELDNDNISIENQKNALQKYVDENYPNSTIVFYEDRDRSGFSFSQREGYQEMRKQIEKGMFDIVLFKDSSRFSRSNGKGLGELEFFQDCGIKVIYIEDGIINPWSDENWMKTAMLSMFNEMPVRETSKKVKNVIKNRQTDGAWVTAVPYGYIITDTKKMKYEVDKEAVEPIKMVFELYNQGWGYKKIANHLTDLGFPTPTALEIKRNPDSKKTAKDAWSIVTIQGILGNDFYIGTLRQRKYSRKKINGADVKNDEDEQIIFENHHEPIIDYRTFAITQEELKKRKVMNYRGVKIYDNVYSGYLVCGDCGSPMFSMSRNDLAPAYRCGAYHNRGLKGCTSHHTRVDFLDSLLKRYIAKVRDNSQDMMDKLNEAIKREKQETKEDTALIEKLHQNINDAKAELKQAKKQRLKELVRKPDDEELINEMYDEVEIDLTQRIYANEEQLKLTADRKNSIVKTNRIAKTAIDIFNEIIEKQSLDKHDIDLIIDKIIVYEDRINIKLKPDIDGLLGIREGESELVNFNIDIQTPHTKAKSLNVSVISNGDPLEIYTDREGEIIFKKYSPIGELGSFAVQYAETLSKTSGYPTLITDKDSVVAVSGVPKKELNDKKISLDLERIMREKTTVLVNPADNRNVPVVDGADKYTASVVCPIVSEGDSIGTVVFLTGEAAQSVGEVEAKLAESAAGFLGKQMEE